MNGHLASGILSTIVMILNMAYIVGVYVFTAFSLYKIAVNNNVKNPWIAFIPIFQYYIIGDICEEYVILGYNIRHLKWVMVGFNAMQYLSGLVAVLQLLVNLLLALILHKFYYMLDQKNALIYAVISVLGRLPMAVILFMLKDRRVTMSSGAYPYPFADKKF